MSINKPQRDFAKDRAICEAATPGPWMNDNLSNSLIWGPKGPGFGLIAKANYGILWRDNARFIAEARTGWPAALDEIERLRAALERIKKWADDPEPVTMLKIWNLANETLKGDENA